MGQELSLDALSNEMKNLQEHGRPTRSFWNKDTGRFEIPTSYEGMPYDGTPINDAAEGGFYYNY